MRVEYRGLPPFKANPGPGSSGAKQRQADFKAAAESQLEAWRSSEGGKSQHFRHPWDPMNARIDLHIKYNRVKGGNDSANIIGGICDALQGVLYADDRQVTVIDYREVSADEDSEDILVVDVSAEPEVTERVEEIIQAQIVAENWDSEVDESWSARASEPGESIPGPNAASDAAKALGASKLSATTYRTLQGILDR